MNSNSKTLWPLNLAVVRLYIESDADPALLQAELGLSHSDALDVLIDNYLAESDGTSIHYATVDEALNLLSPTMKQKYYPNSP